MRGRNFKKGFEDKVFCFFKVIDIWISLPEEMVASDIIIALYSHKTIYKLMIYNDKDLM